MKAYPSGSFYHRQVGLGFRTSDVPSLFHQAMRVSGTALVRAFLVLAVSTLVFAQGPPLLSSDQDGVPDDWKAKPVEIHVPGKPTVYLDLSKQCVKDLNGNRFCVKKGQKTIVLLVDWMAGSDHSHKPTHSMELSKAPVKSPQLLDPTPLSRVQQAFLNKGIVLVIVFADQLFNWIQPIPEQQSLGHYKLNSNEYDWKDFDKIRKNRTGDYDQLFGHGFHYAAFIHTFASTSFSGLSKTIPGDEFLVAMGPFDGGTADQQTGTFMHELGHNLGLRHGGFENTNYKPNYLSVMNYMFQMSGTGVDSTFGIYRYSSIELNPINEKMLDPSAPLSSQPAYNIYSTAFACFNGKTMPDHFDVVGNIGLPPDSWVCKPPAPVAWDINGDRRLDILNSYNDWDHIKYRGTAEPAPPGTIAGGSPGAIPLPSDELPAGWPPLIPEVDSVRATVNPDRTVTITWNPITQQDVIGYQVIRKGPSGDSLIRQATNRSFVDKEAKPGVTYTYSVVPVFYGTREKFRDLVANVPNSVLESARYLQSQAQWVLPNLKHAILVRGKRASAGPIVVK
jgi:hypothetical protein